MKKILFLAFFTVTAFFANAQTVNKNDKFGFLEFTTNSECYDFVVSLVGKSHEDVRKFLNENGFNSLGLSKFSGAGSADAVDENQAAIYSLNADGVVSINKVALKIVNQGDEFEAWKDLLLIKSDILDESIYKAFAAGEFNSETMKKYTSTAEECDGTSIPTGKRPFWGTGTVVHNLVNGCSYTCKRDYRFWIAVGPEYGCTEPVCTGAF